MIEPVMLAFVPVVLAERFPELGKRIDLPRRRDCRTRVRHASHQPLHVLEFSLSRPAGVASRPHRARIEPDGERFCKVFVGMTLGVPMIEVLDEALAVGFWRVVFRIFGCGTPKEAPPRSPPPQAVGIVDRVTRF